MKFSIRREVDFNNIEGRLSELQGVPIELALPYRVNDYLEQRAKMPELERFIKDNKIIVHSVHATQGHLTDKNFMDWAGETVKLAEKVGASVVVFHPESKAMDMRLNYQVIALQSIKRLQRECAVIIAIETFGNKKRVLTPEEIIEKKLPMVLDTSHLYKDRIIQVIEKYHKGIVNVHLSAVAPDPEHPERPGEETQHQPIGRDSFCFHVVERLQQLGWDGIVTLEYMPWHHSKLIEDRQMLDEIFNVPEPRAV